MRKRAKRELETQGPTATCVISSLFPCVSGRERLIATEQKPALVKPPQFSSSVSYFNAVPRLHLKTIKCLCVCVWYVCVDAPWCGHCKQLEPLYAEAAGKLKEEGGEMRLAKVDVIQEKELGEEFNIGGFPTLKLFVKGDRKNPVEYTGNHKYY